MHSMSTWCPGDVPVIGRMTEASTGRCNCLLHLRLLSSALTSRPFPISPAETERFETTLHKAKLWHFDHPNLYRLIFSIAGGRESHQLTVTFGVRRLEAKGSGFYLNGERVRLMGVERMAGSNPEFG